MDGASRHCYVLRVKPFVLFLRSLFGFASVIGSLLSVGMRYAACGSEVIDHDRTPSLSSRSWPT